MKRTTSASEIELVRDAVEGRHSRRALIRRGLRAGLGLSTVAALALTPRTGNEVDAAGSVIPPNCIYVCCDGTCDSWKMCLRCVTWPKTTTTIASR